MKMNIQRLLAVVAHPDDEVLGCGGMLRRLVCSGARVRVLVLGEGSSCRFDGADIRSDAVVRAKAERRRFADCALATLGISDSVFRDLPCGRFDTVPILDIGKVIEREIAEFRPDTVITHFGEDVNLDHRITFNATLTATRPLESGTVRNLLSFETLSSSEWRFTDCFKPTFFVDIDDYIDVKVAAFLSYAKTEARPFPFPRCEEGLRTLAKLRGMQVGLRSAEAYQVIRSVYRDPH
jgi:LmbE family N-acetylglucosaminyl deacetylase